MDSKYTRNQLIEQCSISKEKFEKLNLPNLRETNIKITFRSIEPHDLCIDEIDLLTKFPVQESEYMNATIVELNLLNGRTQGEQQIEYQPEIDKRNIFEIWLEFNADKELSFEAGDSIGFMPGNFDNEVAELIDLLNLNAKKDDLIEIENLNKNLSLPKRSTLTQLIKYCIEIRAIPKKVALLAFSEFCSDKLERDCLVLLSSKEGGNLYDEYILEKHFGLLDLLRNFKSCKPDLNTFLSHSINFVPRYYSVIEHSISENKEKSVVKLKNCENIKCKLKIAFNVTHLPAYYDRTGTQLFGVFTGQINELYKRRQTTDLVEKMSSISIGQKNLYIFKRKNLLFKLSEKVAKSFTIMISIGTGITPFLSLIKQVQKCSINENNNKIAVIDMFKRILNPDLPSDSPIDFNMTSLYLIHGCTTAEDCLYIDELNELHKSGVLSHLQICYSRVPDYTGPKHVQDYLVNCELLKRILVRPNVNIYVCGDQNRFPKDVFNAFEQLLNIPDAKKILKKMQREKRYLEDKWL